MLDTKLTELAGRMTQIQFDERTKQLNRDIAQKQNEAAMKGLGHSNVLAELLYDLSALDIELRTLIVWQNLRRAVSEARLKPYETLAEDLKQEVLRYRDFICSTGYDALQTVIHNTGFAAPHPLTDSVEKVLAKVNAEIDFYVLALNSYDQVQRERGDFSQSVLNFLGPVANVQTGPNAMSTVVQNITSHDREGLLAALHAIKQSLAKVETLPVYPKNEIVELVEDAHAEVSKPKPNSARLQSILQGIGTAVQTVGSIQPAYQTLKTAAAFLGIPLP